MPESVPLEHHAFGMMLGKDGRPYKTRSGGTVKLVDLLNEAEERASALLESRNNDLSAERRPRWCTPSPWARSVCGSLQEPHHRLHLRLGSDAVV